MLWYLSKYWTYSGGSVSRVHCSWTGTNLLQPSSAHHHCTLIESDVTLILTLVMCRKMWRSVSSTEKRFKQRVGSQKILFNSHTSFRPSATPFFQLSTADSITLSYFMACAVPDAYRREPWWVPRRGHNDLLEGGNEAVFYRWSLALYTWTYMYMYMYPSLSTYLYLPTFSIHLIAPSATLTLLSPPLSGAIFHNPIWTCHRKSVRHTTVVVKVALAPVPALSFTSPLNRSCRIRLSTVL